MASSLLALARERLKTIAESEGMTGECALLANVNAADLECWKRYSPGGFQFLAVCESVLSYAGVDDPTAINVYLYMQTSDTGAETMDDLISSLKAFWINPDNFPPGELVCATVTFDAYETMIDEPAGVLLRAHITCYFPGF